MDVGHFWGEFQLICHSSLFLHYWKWPDVSWRNLPSGVKPCHSFHWGYSEVHKISGLKMHFTVFVVVVALLSGLGGSQAVLNFPDLFFCLQHQVGTKYAVVSGLGPVSGGTTL